MDNQPLGGKLQGLAAAANMAQFPSGSEKPEMTPRQFQAEAIQRACLGHYSIDFPEEEISLEVLNFCQDNGIKYRSIRPITNPQNRVIFSWEPPC